MNIARGLLQPLNSQHWQALWWQATTHNKCRPYTL